MEKTGGPFRLLERWPLLPKNEDKLSPLRAFYIGQMLFLEEKEDKARDFLKYAVYYAPQNWQHAALLAKILLKAKDLFSAEKAIEAAQQLKNGKNLTTECTYISILYAQRKIRIGDDALAAAKRSMVPYHN